MRRGRKSWSRQTATHRATSKYVIGPGTHVAGCKSTLEANRFHEGFAASHGREAAGPGFLVHIFSGVKEIPLSPTSIFSGVPPLWGL